MSWGFEANERKTGGEEKFSFLFFGFFPGDQWYVCCWLLYSKVYNSFFFFFVVFMIHLIHAPRPESPYATIP